MTKAEFLSVGLTRREKLWGLGYLLFQIFFLPTVLNMIGLLLPFPLDSTRLNLLYMTINLLAVALIFPRFLVGFFPLGGKKLLHVLIIGAVGFFLYWMLSLVLGHLLGLIQPDFTNQNDQAIIEMAEINYGLMLIGTVILAPITEEVFFRGLLFRGLYDHSPVLAWIVSVSVFSAIHLLGYIQTLSPMALLVSFVQYLPAGLCLAASYRLSGTLICPILIHAAINAVGMLVVG